jgi:hypothetical protein
MKILPKLDVLNEKTSRLYHLNMIFSEDEDTSIPIITFTDADKKIVHPESLGISGSETVKSAFKNLEEVEIKWDQPFSDSNQILEVADSPFASEKILDKKFLKELAESIQTAVLLVAIPVENSLLICPSEEGSLKDKFIQKVNDYYNDFSRNQQTRIIFKIKDGAIIDNFLPPNTKSDKPDKVKKPEGYQSEILTTRFIGGGFSIKVLVSCAEFETMIKGLFVDLLFILKQYGPDTEFTGTVEFQSESDKPKKSANSEKEIFDFFQKIKENPSLMDLKRKSGKEIKLAFLFGTDFQKGDIHLKIKTNL